MVEYKERPQRLYLAKSETEDNDIYVDTICLPQHQYDGIRFLYKLYRKGKAGAILNDPSGYGKRVQTVLFLSAMRPQMALPILILCTEAKERMWTQRFNKWTNMGPDVTVQKYKEIVRPVCVISAFYHISALFRREWGVVVVDDNNVSRDVLRSGLNAKYKIWLTSIDMKKNLQTFSLIYKWFFPNDRFVVEDFQETNKTPTVLLTKSAKLDAFMEDIVLRRKDVSLPLGKSSQTPAVSRKNKDATGKKIKRSKCLPEIEQKSPESQKNGPELLSNNGDLENKNESVEDFFVNINNEAQSKMNKHIAAEDLASSDVTSNPNNDIEKDSVNKLQDKDEELVKTQVMEIEFNIDGNQTPKSDSVMECDTQDDCYKVLSSNNILSENITIKYDSDTPDIDDEIANDNIPAKKSKYTNEINYKDNQIGSEDLFSVDTLSFIENKIGRKLKNRNTMNNTANALKDEKDSKINKNHSENVFSTDLPSDEAKDEIKTGDLNRKKHELCNKNNVSEYNKTDQKLDGVELKVKQMEDIAMKKFKGSFLDNMF